MKINFNHSFLPLLFACQLSFAQATLVKDIFPGNSYSDPGPEKLTSFGNFLYFCATDKANEVQLWKSDGTEAGTQKAVDLQQISSDSTEKISRIIPLKTKLLLESYGTTGRYYISDGTQPGTVLLNYFVNHACVVNDKVLIFRNDSLFLLNETNGSASLIKKLVSSPLAFYTRPAEKLYYFISQGTGTGKQLYVTDGTAEGTKFLHEGDIREIAEVKDENAYFIQCDELWTTSGTVASVKKLHEFMPDGCYSSYIYRIRQFGSKLYIGTSAERAGAYSLYIKDLTKSDPPVKRSDIPASEYGSAPYNFAFVNGKVLYFAGTNYLYAANPLTDEVVNIARFPGWVSGGPEWYTSTDSRIYFYGDLNVNGFEPHESDGTSAGTRLLADIRYSNSSSYPKYFTMHKNELYFSAYSDYGTELFKHTPSSALGLEEQDFPEKEKTISGFYDLMGRKITKAEEHPGVIIIKYSDGSSTKVIISK